MAHLEEKTISSEQKFDGRIVKLANILYCESY